MREDSLREKEMEMNGKKRGPDGESGPYKEKEKDAISNEHPLAGGMSQCITGSLFSNKIFIRLFEKKRGEFVMASDNIGYIVQNLFKSNKVQSLQKNSPRAFLLFYTIISRAELSDNGTDFEALIGDFKNSGIETEWQYRMAKKYLIDNGFINVVETSRNRHSGSGYGTKVKMIKFWEAHDRNYETKQPKIRDLVHNSDSREEFEKPARGFPAFYETKTVAENHKKEPAAPPARANVYNIPKIAKIVDKKETRKKKETSSKKSSSKISPLFVDNEEKKRLVKTYAEKGVVFTELDAFGWLRKFELGFICKTIDMLIHQKAKADHWPKYIQKALSNNFLQQNENEIVNRTFAFAFKNKHNWADLHITQKYCTLGQSGKDFQFWMTPTSFAEQLERSFQNLNRCEDLDPHEYQEELFKKFNQLLENERTLNYGGV
jgi:hypothetical protein